MLVLGIESSCDDMGAAVVEDGSRILSNVVSSQNDVHARYGGVVPELASRRHIETIVPVVSLSLEKAGVALDDIDAIAVTQGPGLVGSILVGLTFAKSLAFARKIPFTGVNHILAHAFAAFVHESGRESRTPSFPLVALIVSGGHTTLIHFDDYLVHRVIGQTLDDAAGEAFDKVAKLLGLGYPGGPAIDALARGADPEGLRLTRPYLSKESLDFSFSGLKTAILSAVRDGGARAARRSASDIAASFQEAVVDVLVAKGLRALDQTGARTLIVAGGVACNSRLRHRFSTASKEKGFDLFIPAPLLCSDNGAIIASLGYHRIKNRMTADLVMNAIPTFDGL